MRPIIHIENVGKRYQIASERSSYATLRESLVASFTKSVNRLRGRGESNADRAFWALRGINLDVVPGERLGIVGINGAGKSTLLKILSRITEPTEGRARLYGRVGSLLEVGTGFHGELTGRENIYLNGAILGMKHAEIARNFDEIIAFAELGRFLNVPVKRYSSGMYMRLAFAVAAHLQPEILIVDEVLAVGDAAFQKKCLGKMSEVSQNGRTVIFVSHNMAAVQNLCSRVLWLAAGQVVDDGEPTRVIGNYLKTTLTTMSQQTWPDPAAAPGNDRVRLRRAAIVPAAAEFEDHFTVRTPLRVEFEYWNLIGGTALDVAVIVRTEEGYPIFSTSSGGDPRWNGQSFPAGLYRSSFEIPGDLLNDGVHRVELSIRRNERQIVYRLDDVLVFEVIDTAEDRMGSFRKSVGAVRPPLAWQTTLLEEQLAADTPPLAETAS
ncbi:MAG: lipopolysaccharide transport system ATP-binding protein [Thermoanaerobaculia bacterium]|jgi:lipopolysaccharide transport system ATP-binding protein|nr:lipopolysaccharide transport system ATP-binding protein [Thermoanaerobaculia bacterium]